MTVKSEMFSEYRMYDILTHYCSKGETVEMEPANLGLTSHGMTMRPDLYLPNGCKALHLKPKTIIELHSELDFDLIQSLRIIHDNFYHVMRDKGYYFLCVLMSEEEIPVLTSFNKIPIQGRFGEDFQIKPLKELLDNVQQKNKNLNIKEQHREDLVLKKAATAITSEQCSFILGAGVSMDAKLPSWETLLKRLVDKAKKDYGLKLDSNDYNNLFSDCGSSSIILGRLVYTLFNDNESEFKQAIRQALYQEREYQPGALADTI